jgi:hypothetical protein
MANRDEIDDPRRRILLQALATGVLGAAGIAGKAEASLFGDSPGKLPAGRSIYRMDGRVLVNGSEASRSTIIRPGDTVETAEGAEIVFVVGSDSYILRGGSKLQLQATRDPGIADALKLWTGKLLTAFAKGRHEVRTGTTVVGIRGTGIYLESDPEETYLCTCYGITDISALNDRSSRETVSAKHHDRPLYIAAKAQPGRAIRNAPMKNHTDMELMLIEELVGRTPPFVFPADDYSAPRRDY